VLPINIADITLSVADTAGMNEGQPSAPQAAADPVEGVMLRLLEEHLKPMVKMGPPPAGAIEILGVRMLQIAYKMQRTVQADLEEGGLVPETVHALAVLASLVRLGCATTELARRIREGGE
jgi:hypothetical protein